MRSVTLFVTLSCSRKIKLVVVVLTTPRIAPSSFTSPSALLHHGLAADAQSDTWQARWLTPYSCRWEDGPSVDGSSTLRQCVPCPHVALSATFIAMCVVSNTWNGPCQRQCFLLRSFITTRSPGFRLCSGPCAGSGAACFTCIEILDNNLDTSTQYLSMSSSHKHVIITQGGVRH